MIVGLRDFSLREFLKKNINFISGVLTEVGLIAIIMLASLAICAFLVLI